MRSQALPSRSGFALGLVVLLLFAIGVAAATGYQVVATEFAMASYNRDGQQALAVARGGLQRFLAEHIGALSDSSAYAIGGGVATVTAKRLVTPDSLNHLYYVRSEGVVVDARTAEMPARRVVGTYAWHRREPVPHLGGIASTGGVLAVEGSAVVNGLDGSTPGECLGAGPGGTAGVATAGGAVAQLGGTIVGAPPTQGYPSARAVYDAVGLRWDILSDPSFPVEFDGAPPSFGSLPADSFPLVRVQGDLVADGFWSGRGALVVTGTFWPAAGFDWDGIILAGSLGPVSDAATPRIDGALIAGMNGPNPSVRLGSGTYRYHYCNVRAANRALGYLDVLPNTVFEVR